MTAIASSLSAATRSQARLSADISTVAPTAAGDASDDNKVGRHRHGPGGHEDHGVRAGRRSDGAQAWATLSLQVSQTFSALTGTGVAGSATATTDPVTPAGSEGSDGGTFSLKLKIEASGGGEAFQGAMKEFVQALYGALQSLFNPQGGSATPVGTATEPIKVAPPDVAGVAPGEPDPYGAPPAPAEPGTPAAPDTRTTAATAPAAAASGANPPAIDTPPVAASPTRSVSVQMRLSYGGGLNGSLGSLVSQLAAQQSAAAGASGAANGGTAGSNDLAASFQRLLDASPAASASGTTLAGFLQALARSFGGTAGPAPEPVVDTTGDQSGANLASPGATATADGGKMPGVRYSLAAAYSVVQGDTRVSLGFRAENGPRAPGGPAPVAVSA